MMKIGYVSECDRDYAKELKSIQTFDDLKLFVTKWRLVANDAYKAIHNHDFNWEEFREGRTKENRGEYAGDSWAKKYGAILMPEILLRVAVYAQHFVTPWGVTYIRLREFGKIVETKTHAKWVENLEANKT